MDLFGQNLTFEEQKYPPSFPICLTTTAVSRSNLTASFSSKWNCL